jgi:hypothetical protein
MSDAIEQHRAKDGIMKVGRDASRVIRQVLLCVADRRWDPVFPVKEHKSKWWWGGGGIELPKQKKKRRGWMVLKPSLRVLNSTTTTTSTRSTRKGGSPTHISPAPPLSKAHVAPVSLVKRERYEEGSASRGETRTRPAQSAIKRRLERAEGTLGWG